jgi:hypothetical protein
MNALLRGSCLLILTATALPTLGDEQHCEALPPMSQYSPGDPPQGCICGDVLRSPQLTLSLQPPFVVGAVCNLRWLGGKGERVIDLRSERITLDEYTDGWLPFGFVLLRGHAELRGELIFEPGPSGDYWFSVVPGLVVAQSSVVPLHTLKLPVDVIEASPPRQLQEAQCWIADAVLDVRDIWLLIGDNDEAGAYPSEFRLEAAYNYRACADS